VGAAELRESLGPQAIGDIPVGHYVPLLEFNHLYHVVVALGFELGSHQSGAGVGELRHGLIIGGAIRRRIYLIEQLAGAHVGAFLE